MKARLLYLLETPTSALAALNTRGVSFLSVGSYLTKLAGLVRS